MRLNEIMIGLRDRTLMWVRSEDFNSVVSFIDGYDTACENGPLCGFNQWLGVRAQLGANWHWSALVLYLACPDVHRGVPLPEAADKAARKRLFELFLEFDAERAKPDGLMSIFDAYSRWRDEVLGGSDGGHA